MDELAKRFADLAEQYGPQVANAAKEAARIEAYSTLVSGLICGIVGAVLAYLAIYIGRKLYSEEWQEVLLWPLAAILAVIAVALGWVFLWAFADPWTWATINHPELWIAKKAFKL